MSRPARPGGLARPVLVLICVLLVVAAGCAPSTDGPAGAAGSASDDAASDRNSSENASGADGTGVSDDETGATIQPLGFDAGVRLGRGRAVAAATAGPVTVVATTIGAQVRIDDRWQPLDLDPQLGPPDGIDVSDDGTRLVLWWSDHAQLWSVDGDPGLVQRIEAQDARASFTGTDVLVVTPDSMVVLDPVDGTEVARHRAPTGLRFGPTAADPDGEWLAAALIDPAGADQLLLALDGADPVTTTIPDRDQLDVFQLDADPADRRLMIGLSPDGQRFSGGEILVWDIELGGVASSATIEAASMWTVGDDGRLIIVGQDGYLLIGADGAPGQAQPLPDGYPPFAVHPRPGGRFLIIRQDASRLILDGDQIDSEPVPPGRFALTSHQAGDPATVSFVDQTGDITVIGPDDISRHLDDLVAGTINDIDISTDGDLAVATSTGSINLLADAIETTSTTGSTGSTGVTDPVGRDWTSEFAHAEGNVDTVVFSPDGTQLVGGVAERRSAVIFDDTVAVWDLSDEQRIVEIGGEREEVQDCSSFANIIRLASDGSFLVGVSHDFTVFVLDGATYQQIQTMPPHAAPILDLALSPDDRWLVTTSEDSTTRVWNLQTGELAADYPTILGGYRSIDFLADSERLLVADRQGGLVVVDALTGEEQFTFESVVSGASDVDVSPDGRFVAAGDGPVLRVWAADTGKVVDEFVGHHGSVTTTAFSPDGSKVISGSNDGTAVIWQLAA